jgi:hypothetical protein
MKTLKLFNAVVAKTSKEAVFVSRDGYIIDPSALWAKTEIMKFLKNEKLDGYGLNKTFHKSWQKIFSSSREDLLIDQIQHYISTYGSGFQDEVYIPEEVLDIPDTKVVFKYINAYSEKEMTQKCLNLLTSGIALKEQTIDDLLSVLIVELSYKFTGKEKIKNKEAIVKLADMYGVLPTDTMEFFRYIIYRATGDTLLIKSNDAIEKIQTTNFNPAVQFELFGLEKLAEIFNRFKPLFLAFKPQCAKTINKISKLSKTHHKPMISNPLNLVTSMVLNDNDKHWLDNATPYALFRALAACHNRVKGQTSFTYRIRSGKSFVKQNAVNAAAWENYVFLKDYLKTRFDLTDKTFYFPQDIEYALPSSEKMFVGNIPTGTKFYGDALAVGIYWENSWGARDLDLSGLNISGKVGWNSSYNQNKGQLMYSGDITNAPDGAVEYLYANKGLAAPTLVKNNVYSGQPNCDYKIIVGKGDSIDYNYMMNPNNLFVESKCSSVQRQTVLGMLIPEGKRQSFVLLNFGAGQTRVSGNSEISKLATQALYQEWSDPLSFKEVVLQLGGQLSDTAEDADFDFTLSKLKIDTLIEVFS